MAEMQPKTRVLIVDDDQTLCDMYAERLKAEGFEVVVAHNGEEGAAKAVEYLPNVILLDLMMPKVNGFNTLEILKSTEETKNIPVLILTALIQEENKKRGIQAGAEGYIVKSETMPGAVIEKIKAAVEKGKRMQQAASQQPTPSTPPPVNNPGMDNTAPSPAATMPAATPPPVSNPKTTETGNVVEPISSPAEPEDNLQAGSVPPPPPPPPAF